MAATIIDPLPQRRKEDFPFAQYADDKYPLLKIAAANQQRASSYKVEWLVDGQWDNRWENFTQIFRTPFTPDPESGDREMWRALERHLQDVENALWFGNPSYVSSSERHHGHPIGTCGGALHYLKREPLSADTFVLRVLQDCVLLKDRGVAANRVDEFLSEISLQVNPAPKIRAVSNRETVNAWAQGASL